MKSVDKYLLYADKAIKSSNIATGNTIPAAYKGAVSSFGASLIMSGLVPTMQFFMSESDKRDSDSRKIIEAIAQIIDPSGSTDAEGLKTRVMIALGINNPQTRRVEIKNLKVKIINAAIALKIMMRSYRFSGDEVGVDNS